MGWLAKKNEGLKKICLETMRRYWESFDDREITSEEEAYVKLTLLWAILM